MHKPDSVPESEIYKFIWDLVTETDPLISARRPDLDKKKRTSLFVDFAVLSEHRPKTKR